MVFRLLAVIAFAFIAPVAARAATIGVAPGPNGEVLEGVKIEGEIEPGDANKFIRFYAYFGPIRSRTVFLRSKGGNVAEAMAIGRLVHQFRLTTQVPSHDVSGELEQGYQFSPSDDRGNFLCASSCFLIYAGGVERHGDYLILHRPYFRRSDLGNISDEEYESQQKKLDDAVRQYLRDMEVDQFYLDKLMATNSQDGYTISMHDDDAHPLEDMPPSIEEIVLSKCKRPSKQEEDEADRSPPYSPARMAIGEKDLAWFNCQSEEMRNLRYAAWQRFSEHVAELKCGKADLSDREKVILEQFYSKPPKERTDEEIKKVLPIFHRQNDVKDCQTDVTTKISIAAMARNKPTKSGEAPPEDFQFGIEVTDFLR